MKRDAKDAMKVEIRDVHYSYRLGQEAVPVLGGLSFEVKPGQMVAIQGPSGSGKSTLLYLLGCLLKPDRGHVRVDGVDISRLDPEALARFRNQRIGFVFQQFHLLPRATVLQNILLPSFYPCETAHPGEAEKEKARALAERLGLGERLEHFPNQLSGGQQQRVAIARALMNDPEILLADEPTGNLDSKSAAQILDILKELNARGKTVILITHDSEVARKCPIILHVRDGKMVGTDVINPGGESQTPGETPTEDAIAPMPASRSSTGTSPTPLLRMLRSLVPLAVQNIHRNRMRSALTMLGITIGIASVLVMVTLGQFTKRKILDSYAELGVRTLMFYGYPNWEMKATDMPPVMYRAFDWDRDIEPIKRIFPQIKAVSPALTGWDATLTFGGKSIEKEARIMGVAAEAIQITHRELQMGTGFTPLHVSLKNGVCLIGSEIAQRLFKNGISPVGQVMHVSEGDKSFACRILGVMKPRTSNNEWMKPNLQVIVPYTFFQLTRGEDWDSRIHNVLIQVRDGFDIEATGRGIRSFFEMKYGKSGRFRVDSDSLLITQMTKFLTLFTVMLASIALVSLAVGGIGITNMMLVSVTERLKEIGLRKAVGATDSSIRLQFLLEAIVICAFAGLIGLLFGVAVYESIVFGASKFVPKLSFEWIFDPWAMGVSLISILAVGVFSGLVPAIRAEKLQVIEALRAD